MPSAGSCTSECGGRGEESACGECRRWFSPRNQTSGAAPGTHWARRRRGVEKKRCGKRKEEGRERVLVKKERKEMARTYFTWGERGGK